MGSWISRPTAGRENRDFLASLRQDHDQRQRELRYRTLLEATEWALGARSQAWLRNARIRDQRAYDLALSSEAGLDEGLRALSALAGRQEARRPATP